MLESGSPCERTVRFKFVTCVLLLGIAGSTALGSADPWRAYVEVEGRTRDSNVIGGGNLFLPLWQNERELLFADFRGHWNDIHAHEGNWGLAYRKVVVNDWIVGVHAFYDARRTQFDNTFHQGTVGLELLDVNWGLRANGYIPSGNVGTAPGLNAAVVAGGNLFVRRGEERAYHGFDLEGEWMLWRRPPRCGDRGRRWGIGGLALLDAELWVAGGVFHFDNHAAGFDNITGPRLRSELRLFDLPALGNDSRLVLGGQYENDGVRGNVGTALLNIRIPLGRRSARSRRLSRHRRRMVAPIVRDVDIVTHAALGEFEPAKIERTGRAITGVVTVDGTTVNPEGVISSAGADSVVIASGAAGTINTTGSITLGNGQVLMGGGSSLAVVGCLTGARAIFTAPGPRPTIRNGTTINNAIVLTDNVTVLGIDAVGGNNTFHTGGLDVANVHVLNTSASGADDDGYDFEAFTGLFDGNRAFNNGEDGFDFEGTINGRVTNNVATGNTDDGFDFIDIGPNGFVSGNTASQNNDDGFCFFDVFGTFSNNTAIGNADDGFNFVDVDDNARVTGNRATGNGGVGFDFDDVEDGALFSGNVASGNTGDGFNFDRVESGGRAIGNVATGNGGDGFDFTSNDAGGTFSNNTANGNTGRGFRNTLPNAGTAVNNNGSGNTGGGNTFP